MLVPPAPLVRQPKIVARPASCNNAGTESADKLRDHICNRAFIGYAPLDAFGYELGFRFRKLLRIAIA